MTSTQRFEAVVIGASAGAIEALSAILPALPGHYPLPVIIVVHVPSDKDSVMAELFTAKCALTVKESEDKEPLQPGTVYFAAPDYHLQVEPSRHLSFAADEPVLFSRPSIDILFETAADTYGKGLIGVILSGASHDGAAGLKAIVDAGGVALVQQLSTAYASTMPQAALQACKPQASELSLAQITDFLIKAAPL